MSVVAVKEGKVYASFIPDCAMKHSVLLMPTIEETLNKAQLRLADCDFFSAVVGAGSFTGIRIGVSAMKGFALATGKPTLPVTSFETIAYNAIDTKEAKDKVLCLVDALHDCYYACGYDKGEEVLAPAYLTEEEVLALVQEGYTLYGVGELAISQKQTVLSINPTAGLVNAVQNKAGKNAFGELTALYVRKSSAEENLKL